MFGFLKKKKNERKATKGRCYISGKITGFQRTEYMTRFARAEEMLTQLGYEVVNPTKALPCRWPLVYRLLGYRLTLCWDLALLSKCEWIYKIPGWKESPGANIEGSYAYNVKINQLPTSERWWLDSEMTYGTQMSQHLRGNKEDVTGPIKKESHGREQAGN